MMKLDDALSGVAQLGFDTPPFIYFVERHPAYVDLIRAIIQRVDRGTILGFASVVTLTEVLTQPIRFGNTTLEIAYRNLLLQSRNFALISIDPIIAGQAADLRARYNLRTPDALQLAAALNAGCDAFLTNDAALKRVTELRILLLDELEL